jgi:hypothetical protein
MGQLVSVWLASARYCGKKSEMASSTSWSEGVEVSVVEHLAPRLNLVDSDGYESVLKYRTQSKFYIAHEKENKI